MSLTFTMRQMVEAGVHYGHHARRWNPKMGQYLYGKKDSVHIIDLRQSVPMFYQALNAVRDVAAQGGKVLFVGTKRQAQDPIREAAERCGQYYVNYRWLGGMLTNWKTVSKSIKHLKDITEMSDKNDFTGYTKKEILNLKREKIKLDQAIGGIQDMNGQPDIIFIIDTTKESLAIKEAKKLGVPVVAICDSNSDPDEIDFPVPGNDDAIRAIKFYCDYVSGAVLDGIKAEMTAAGVDVGAAEAAPETDVDVDDETSEEA